MMSDHSVRGGADQGAHTTHMGPPVAPLGVPPGAPPAPPHGALPWIEGPLSLEERIRIVRERCRLLADLFSIQAEATFLACHVSMSADAYNALTDICRSSADDLERLAQDIPGAIANWCPALGDVTSSLEGEA